MQPVDPAELSALLDGELPASRAEEIRAALRQDPQLQRTYDQLVALDADWKERASTAMFQPQVSLEERFIPGGWLVTAAILVLLGFRIAVKLQSPLLGSCLEVLLLAMLVGYGLHRIMHATDADRPRLAPVNN